MRRKPSGQLNELNKAAHRAGKDSYQAQQASHAVEIFEQAQKVSKTQAALDKAAGEFEAHQASMTVAEKSATKAEVARLRDEAVVAQNKKQPPLCEA